jgi:hypothetical protein
MHIGRLKSLQMRGRRCGEVVSRAARDHIGSERSVVGDEQRRAIRRSTERGAKASDPSTEIQHRKPDPASPVSPQGDMVKRAGKLDPQGSRYVRRLLRIDARDKT